MKLNYNVYTYSPYDKSKMSREQGIFGCAFDVSSKQEIKTDTQFPRTFSITLLLKTLSQIIMT